MNKTLQSLLLAALALSAGHLQAYTNKTTLTTRPQSANLALEQSAGWNKFIHLKDKNRYGGSVQSAFFYQDSTNNNSLGRYFGILNKNVINLGFNTAANKDFELGLIIHDAAAFAASRPVDTIKLRPEQQSYGMYLSYHHDLWKVVKGLYFDVNLPVVHVENDVNLIVTGADAATITKYFAGNLNVPANGNSPLDAGAAPGNGSQTTLNNATINGKTSATGPADVDFRLGYKVLCNPDYHLSFNVGMTIPTGNKVTGQELFEPIYGNSQHFGLGAGFTGCARFWGDDEHNAMISIAGDYRCLLEAAEMRTLGIVGQNFGQYQLLGNTTLPINTQQFTPAANVLTLPVNVFPGSQFEGVLALHYNNGGFALDLGFNFYYREAETVSLKSVFTDNTYVIVSPQLATNGAGNVPAANTANQTLGAVNTANIDTRAAATPMVDTYKIYAGLAYMFQDWSNPLLLGLGGHYEFVDRNSALETWGVFVKAGLSF